MRKTCVLVVGVVLAAASLTSGATASSMPARPVAVTHQLPHLLTTKSDVAYTSNWSGYVDLPPAGHTVTAVHTAFVVPATSSKTVGGASTWTGIGGWGTPDLIQAGVEEGSAGGPEYYAWYEVLPEAETILTGCNPDPNCIVGPHDTVKVDIVQKAGQLWSIGLTDVGKWSFSKVITYGSSGTSAEWVLEAPTEIFLGLIGTQTVMPFMENTTFGPGNSYSIDRKPPVKMGTGSPTTVVMEALGLLPEANPSNIASDNDGFTGCTFQGSCPAPAR